jgi:hypothetical protein
MILNTVLRFKSNDLYILAIDSSILGKPRIMFLASSVTIFLFFLTIFKVHQKVLFQSLHGYMEMRECVYKYETMDI